VVFSNKYFINSANLEKPHPLTPSPSQGEGGIVVSNHQADKFIQVKTTSFHQFFSKIRISSKISSLVLE
jgi:hypothetical protein